MGDYYRIPSDNRGLNYNKFFTDGEERITETHDYTSHNTKRLDKKELENILKNLNFLKEELDA
jgi:UDP-glucose 4-epimerase